MTEVVARGDLPASRKARILALLDRDGIVRVSELSSQLGVSAITLRRDLAQYEEQGLLQRVHGGAIPVESDDGSLLATSTGATPALAVLVPSLDFYWPGVIRGMEASAAKHGLRLVLRGASYEIDDERPVLEWLTKTEGVQGLIFAPNVHSPHAQDVIRWLSQRALPVVLVERTAVRPDDHLPLESVRTDHELGGMLAAHHLAELGHRRVGLVVSRKSPTSSRIASGWSQACQELGLDDSEHFEQFIPDHRSAEFSNIVNAIIDNVISTKTTALLVHSDPEAITVVEYALARGISVPGDLSVIAYDDEVAQLYNPTLTAISPPRAAVGSAAVELLIRRIADPSRPPHRVIISPSLNVRETTAQVNSPGLVARSDS